MTPAQLAYYDAGRCWCCEAPADATPELDPDTGLCLYCQPCPSCGSHDGSAHGRCVTCGAIDQS